MIDRDYMVQIANRLTMVAWDRTILLDDDNHAALYGWIADNERDRHDFVFLQFWFDDADHQMSWSTSSAKWSPHIHQLLTPDHEHNLCQPVQGQLRLNKTVSRVATS